MPENGIVSVSVLREAVARGIEELGLRPVSRSLGLDPKSVKAFLDGAEPRISTRRRMEHWYVEREAVKGPQTEAAPFRAAVALLLSGLPAGRRPATEARLVAWLREHYAEELGRVPAPFWLSALDLPDTSPADDQS